MNIIVADSCALILLAKCGMLELLAGAIPVIMPEGVYKEVVNKELLYPLKKHGKRSFVEAQILIDTQFC